MDREDVTFVEQEEGPSVTATDILEHLYCPRFTYFEHCLDIPEHQEKRFKVQKGREVHKDKTRVNPDYLRKKLGCVDKRMEMYLSSSRGLRGVVDEVLFLHDGTAAPLDYKFAEYKERVFRNHRFQLAFYGLLIKDNFAQEVNKGFLVYVRSKNKLIEVELGVKLYAQLEKVVDEFLQVVQKGKYPSPTTYKRRCADCCYRNLCEKVI
jgi:CRISPR-associated exonuclease Cas4